MTNTGNVSPPTAESRVTALPEARGLLNSIGGWVTFLTGVVGSVVIAANSINSYLGNRHDLQIKEIDARTKLAEAYLQRLADPAITIDNRIMYLSAFAELDGHPLRLWAKKQEEAKDKELARVKELGLGLQSKVDAKSSVQSDEDEVASEIAITNMKLEIATNLDDVDLQRKALTELNRKRNLVRGAHDLSSFQDEYLKLANVEKDSRREGVTNPPKDVLVSTFPAGNKTEHFRELALKARLIAHNTGAAEIKVASLRAAALAARDARDAVLAIEIEIEGVSFCKTLDTKDFQINNDCSLIPLSAMLSAYKRVDAVADLFVSSRNLPTEFMRSFISTLFDLAQLESEVVEKWVSPRNIPLATTQYIRELMIASACFASDLRRSVSNADFVRDLNWLTKTHIDWFKQFPDGVSPQQRCRNGLILYHQP